MKRDKYKMERYQSETARVTNKCSRALVAGTYRSQQDSALVNDPVPESHLFQSAYR